MQEKGRNAFTFYLSYRLSLRHLEDADRLALYDAISDYALFGDEPELSGLAAAIFELIKPTLDKSQRLSENRKGKSAKQIKNKTKTDENKSRTKQEPMQNKSRTNQQPMQNKSTTDSDQIANDVEREEEEEREREEERDIERDIDSECYPPYSPPLGEKTALTFETFWDAYPRKVAKQAAEKAFEKISERDRAKILPALERQRTSRAWTKDGSQFIPHPASWLNGRRWEDEEEHPIAPRRETDPAPLFEKEKAEAWLAEAERAVFGR